ncbi:MAG: FecR family protein, partial [Balneolaceae bacterium]
MDKKILQKYFRNQCTLDEVEKVLEWFQTDEGEEYLEKRLNRDLEHYANEENLLLYPDVPTDEMLDAIGRERRKDRFRRIKLSQDAWWSRVAIVLLICGALSAGSYWMFYDAVQMEGETPEVVYRTLSTMEDQQRLVTLEDGTRIRLNGNSSIEIPETFLGDGREVRLNGEAWFKVERDENRPFSIKADRAVVRVLGTEFNVKVDQNSPHVQVA